MAKLPTTPSNSKTHNTIRSVYMYITGKTNSTDIKLCETTMRSSFVIYSPFFGEIVFDGVGIKYFLTAPIFAVVLLHKRCIGLVVRGIVSSVVGKHCKLPVALHTAFVALRLSQCTGVVGTVAAAAGEELVVVDQNLVAVVAFVAFVAFVGGVVVHPFHVAVWQLVPQNPCGSAAHLLLPYVACEDVVATVVAAVVDGQGTHGSVMG